ncbi:MAG: co-chaperone GroES [Alphaproteobacteria bacterium]|nr:co-chaperone GroES [Alphaproteobacteria bacterium]
MKIQAIMDRVIIRLDKAQEKSEGGIILADDIKENVRNIGVVESIGSDVKSVKVGDRVVFHAFDELPTLNNDPDLVVLRERGLMGVICDD